MMPAPAARPPPGAKRERTADGYTLMVGHMGTHGAAPAVYPNLKYDPAKDFTPIGQTAALPMVIVTKKDFPANTLEEFVEYVEEKPGQGDRSTWRCWRANAHRLHAPAIDHGHQNGARCLSRRRSCNQRPGRRSGRFRLRRPRRRRHADPGGTIKAIAIASPERAEIIKDVPTTREGGLADFQVSAWNAVFAPRKPPRKTSRPS